MSSQTPGGSEPLYASAYVGAATPSSLSSTPRSPWEALSSSPSLSSGLSAVSVSDGESLQLAPEVESGNVEYKLKLCHPTPERFTRLVTQLKWRLLAGSGQALYEIGVSDSGQLVGLSRKDLELSLQTLEQMAGELGATMIVQKEITIPASSGTNLEYLLGNGRIDGAPRVPRLPSAFAFDSADVSPLSLTDTESRNGPKDPPMRTRGANVGHKFGRPDGIGAALRRSSFATSNSSPQPIIRQLPYGFDSNGYHISRSNPSLPSVGQTASRPQSQGPRPTQSITIQSRADYSHVPHKSSESQSQSEETADSDVDDDAAFSFDLDINNIVKTSAKPNVFSSSSLMMGPDNDDLSKTITLSPSSRPSTTASSSTSSPFLHAQPNGRVPKYKKPKLLEAPGIDPEEKARRRRARRDAKRDRREDDIRELGKTKTESKPKPKKVEVPEVRVVTPPSPMARGGSAGASESEGLTGNESGSPLSGSELDADAEDPTHQLPETPAPAARLIAEVLVVRKFTVEVEEAYLELDKLRL